MKAQGSNGPQSRDAGQSGFRWSGLCSQHTSPGPHGHPLTHPCLQSLARVAEPGLKSWCAVQPDASLQPNTVGWGRDITPKAASWRTPEPSPQPLRGCLSPATPAVPDEIPDRHPQSRGSQSPLPTLRLNLLSQCSQTAVQTTAQPIWKILPGTETSNRTQTEGSTRAHSGQAFLVRLVSLVCELFSHLRVGLGGSHSRKGAS